MYDFQSMYKLAVHEYKGSINSLYWGKGSWGAHDVEEPDCLHGALQTVFVQNVSFSERRGTPVRFSAVLINLCGCLQSEMLQLPCQLVMLAPESVAFTSEPEEVAHFFIKRFY